MSHPLPRYALIIGSNDYAAFDASVGNDPGTSNLRAAVLDALGYARVAYRAGFAPENIRLLLSGAEGGAQIPADVRENVSMPLPEHLSLADLVAAGRADRETILEGLRWLASKLGEVEGSVGLLAFIGHGAASADDLLYCGSDTVAGYGNAIAWGEVEDILAEVSHRSALTVFLETCHAAAARRRRAVVRTLATGGIPESLARRADRMDAAIVTASLAEEVAMEMPFGLGWRGAFSLAVEQILSRFSTGEEDVPFTISPSALVSRATKLLTAQGVIQRPAARGRPGRLRSAVLAPRDAAVPTDAGMGRLLPQELWPDMSEPGIALYGLRTFDSNGTEIGTGGLVVVTGSTYAEVYGISKLNSIGKFHSKGAYWFFPKSETNQTINPFENGQFRLEPNAPSIQSGRPYSKNFADLLFSNNSFSDESTHYYDSNDFSQTFKVTIEVPTDYPESFMATRNNDGAAQEPNSLYWFSTSLPNLGEQQLHVLNPAPVLSFSAAESSDLPASPATGWLSVDDYKPGLAN